MGKIQLLDFSGGINNSRSSLLIKRAESVDLLDALVNSGALELLPTRAKTEDPNIQELTLQDGDRSIVRFGEEYFFSANSTQETLGNKVNDSTLGSTLGFIGLTAPTTRATVSPGQPGDRFSGGNFRYLFRFKTDQGHSSAVSLPGQEAQAVVEVILDLSTDLSLTQSNFPEFTSTPTTIVVPAVDSDAEDVFGYHAGTRVQFNGKVWKAKVQIRASTFGNIHPLNQPGGGHNFWEEITGLTETVSGLEAVILSDFPKSSQASVTKIDIFRTPVNGTDYYLLATIPSTQAQFEDRLSDGDLVLREKLIFQNAGPPDLLAIDKGDTRVTGKYLTEINERFWMAFGNRLQHSLQSDPHSWNAAHRLDFDGDITALARFGTALLVFIGDGNPYLVQGNAEDNNISKIQISSTKGCPNWKTIAYAGNSPVWFSEEGICGIFKRPTGQDPLITVLSRDRYEFSQVPERALAHKEKYYLFFSDHAVIFDLDRNIFYRSSLTADYGFSSNLTGTLYLVEDDLFYNAEGGTAPSFTYISPRLFGRDRDILKTFNLFTVDAEGDVVLSVFLNGSEKMTDVVSAGKDIRDISIKKIDAHDIQFKVVSSAKINSISAEYTEHQEGQD